MAFSFFFLQKKKENIEPEQPEKKMRPTITNVCALKLILSTKFIIIIFLQLYFLLLIQQYNIINKKI